jgi:hypothetical protein
MSFDDFLNEAKTHYRLVPIVEMIQCDPSELERLKDAFKVRKKDELIGDLYDCLEFLTIPSPINNPNQLSLF